MAEYPDGLRNRVFCDACGRSEARRNGLAPIGWQEMPGREGRTMVMCSECVRHNLWLIEARLDIDPEDPY
ncbi:MAG: hypothetical protein JJE05_09120 [Actinobacteria bacterium]|nr:hypothetical protein [Actinomycetota bacterium]